MAEIEISKKKQVTARMTPQFAADLQLIVSYFGITNVSQILYGSVAAQADAIRARQAGDIHARAPELDLVQKSAQSSGMEP